MVMVNGPESQKIMSGQLHQELVKIRPMSLDAEVPLIMPAVVPNVSAVAKNDEALSTDASISAAHAVGPSISGGSAEARNGGHYSSMLKKKSNQ
uniref:Uncharacterized protein n=1 Tax=Ditylenchus dipsaci TaxID=166011 RepID=A0A915D8J3_9BILA